MFKSKNESNVVYKCTVRLLEDSDVLECEFQVMYITKEIYRPFCHPLFVIPLYTADMLHIYCPLEMYSYVYNMYIL